MPPTIDLAGEDDNSYASSPRPFQEGRSVSTNGQEDAALLDLAGVAVCWLPPPTPPPPEARRRQRARQPSPSPIVPPSCTPRVGGGARLPPPPPSPLPFPQNCSAREGEKKRCWREGPKEKEGEDQIRRDADAEDVYKGEPHVGYRSSARRSEGEGPATTRAESESNTDAKESPSHFLGDNRDRRKKDRKEGGWAGSYERSAAKRRADEVLARIAALEVSFDRVEEQAVVTPPANAIYGARVPELKMGRVRNDAPSALDAQSAAGATTFNMAPITILDTAGEARFWCFLPCNS